MLQIYLTKLCNWAKGIATWTPGLNGPYNPNLTVPQLCRCKMGIMPPCHCTMTVEMTVEINLPTFVKSLSPKLWVSFLPWSGEESELFQTVLVASQPSCPGRNAFLYVLFFMPAPRWRWLWAPWSQNTHSCAHWHSVVQKLLAKTALKDSSPFSWFSMKLYVWPHFLV